MGIAGMLSKFEVRCLSTFSQHWLFGSFAGWIFDQTNHQIISQNLLKIWPMANCYFWQW